MCLIQPETLLKINDLVVRTGHQLEPTAPAKVRGDTFVVKTNIHYPTDANLLADGLRKLCLIDLFYFGDGLREWNYVR